MNHYAIGLDLVDIQRFQHWHTFSRKQLQRILSDEEIDYCLSVPAKSAERFAVRFAAREACYKALAAWNKHNIPAPLLTVFQTMCVTRHTDGRPSLVLDWHALQQWYHIPHQPHITLTLTHTATTAGACALIITN